MKDNGKKMPIPILPHSEDAETGVIGSILMMGQQAIDICVEAHITPEAFYVPANAIIYRMAFNMQKKGRPIDIRTMAEQLKREDLLEKIGGNLALDRFVDQTPTSAHIAYYIQSIMDTWRRRTIIHMSRDIEQEAYENENADEVIANAESALLSLNASKTDQRTPREIVMSVAETMEKAIKHKFSGVPSRFPAINKKLLGYQGFVVIAARPSQGKSTLMLNEIKWQAENGYKPGLISIEMSDELCYSRMACDDAEISMTTINAGILGDQQGKYIHTLSKLAKLSICISDDTPTFEALASRARRWKLRHDIGILWIDYLQLLAASGKYSSRNELVGTWTSGAKALQKQLKIPVVFISQLSRASEIGRAEPRRPKLSDLRDSGTIEQDADVVLLLSQVPDQPYLTLAELAKNRNGPTGDILLSRDFQHMRFKDTTLGLYEKEETTTQYG